MAAETVQKYEAFVSFHVLCEGGVGGRPFLAHEVQAKMRSASFHPGATTKYELGVLRRTSRPHLWSSYECVIAQGGSQSRSLSAGAAVLANLALIYNDYPPLQKVMTLEERTTTHSHNNLE